MPEQRYRDAAKILTVKTDGRAAYCILAVENETKINYAMPVKDELYDFMQLAKQVTDCGLCPHPISGIRWEGKDQN